MADVIAQRLVILTLPSTRADCQSGFPNQIRHSLHLH